MRYALTLLLMLSAITLPVWGHPGRIDSNGGHNNRKTGGYHCHRCPCGCATSKPQRETSGQNCSTVKVKVKQANIRKGPSTGLEVISTAKLGQEFKCTGISGDWFYMIGSFGYGYMHRSTVTMKK